MGFPGPGDWVFGERQRRGVGPPKIGGPNWGPELGPPSGPKIGPIIWAPGPKFRAHGGPGPNFGPMGPWPCRGDPPHARTPCIGGVPPHARLGSLWGLSQAPGQIS